MISIVELLRYNEEIRHKYFETLASLPWDELVKNREASFQSLRNIFIHTMGCSDYWLDFLLGEHRRTQGRYEEYENVKDILEYMERVEARMRIFLDSLTPSRLAMKYKRVKSDTTIEVTGEDVLIHLFEEEVHHRGELIALLWQMGIEPPAMGWKNL
ncbi:MAG: hypothetical protein QG670_1803 [Thermoproteota archaeon]|nr:hypothetical protein [Thermoproteota archaeon]